MLNRRDNNGISRLSWFVLVAAALLCCLSTAPATGAEKPALQVLVVTTADWSAVDGDPPAAQTRSQSPSDPASAAGI